MFMRLLLQIILLSILSLSLNANEKLTKVSVQLEWKHQFEFAGFYAAIENGYYKDIGLDVSLKEYEPNINIVDDVLSNKSTFGISSSALIIEKLNNKPLVLISSYFKQNCLAFVTKKDIKTPSDLKNKIIMALPWEVEHTSLGALLKENNIDKDDYNLVVHDFKIDKFINNEVDAMSIFLTSQIYELDKLNTKYNIINPSDYGLYSYDLELFTSKKFLENNKNLVSEFKQATKRGWEYAFNNKKEIVDLIYNKYSKRKTKNSLLYEAIETEKLFKTHVFKIGSVIPELVSLNANMYKKLGLVKDDFEVNYFLKDYYYKSLKDEESDFFKYNRSKKNIILKDEELEYLKNKKTIKMCVDPDWMPLESIEDKKHIGISADYFKIFKEQLFGLSTIKLIKTKSWEESLYKVKNRECDILSLAMETKDRKEYLNFTKPYFSTGLVLATKKHVKFMDDFMNLKDKVVAIPRGYAFIEILKDRYPNLNIKTVDNIDEGLKKVEEGKVFGYIGTLTSVAYKLQDYYQSNLKISGKFDHKWELSVAVRDDEKILHNIFNKLVESITVDEKIAIQNKWITISYKDDIDYTLVWQILFISIILMGFIVYWNRKLIKLNDELKETTKKAYEVSKFKDNLLSNISHEIRTPMNYILGMSFMLKETNINNTQLEYIKNIENSSEILIQLLNQMLDLSEIENGKFRLNKIDFNLIDLLKNIEKIVLFDIDDKDIKFKIVYDHSLPVFLYGDRLRLYQVLVNLLSNSVKFTDEGTIELTVLQVSKNRFKFIVADTGIGIAKEGFDKLLEPFVQSDTSSTRKYNGTGLGLSISKELVSLMGGDLELDSVVDEGSKFIFEIILEESNKNNKLIRSFKQIDKKEKNEKTKKIKADDEVIEELFLELKHISKKRRPKLCEPIIKKLDGYVMDDKSMTVLKKIKSSINKYNFDEIGDIIDKR